MDFGGDRRMRTQPNGMGKFVQVLGSQAIMGANAAATAAHRGWHDIAGHFKAAQGVVDTSSGFTLPDGVANGIVGSLPRNSLSGELADTARLLPDWHTRFVISDTTATAGLVGEGLAIPVAGTVAQSMTITPNKVGIIVGYSQEMMRDSGNSVAVIEQDFTKALQRGLDAYILARLATGLDSANSFGATDDPMLDMRELISPLDVTGVVSPILAGHPDVLLRMSTLRDSGGYVFPESGISGGQACGMPIYPCDALPANVLRALNPESIGFRVDGVQIVMSNSAAVQASTSPSQDASQGTGSTMISGYQNFSVFAKFTVDVAIVVLRDGIASSELAGINW
jgi:HK97 family phage major capsid protein